MWRGRSHMSPSPDSDPARQDAQPPAVWNTLGGGYTGRPFYATMLHFWSQESGPLNCSAFLVSPGLWAATVSARTLGCVFAAICRLLWGQLRVCLLETESLAPSQPHIQKKINAKLLMSPSGNPIMKTRVCWPTVISRQLHVNWHHTARRPFCPCVRHPWKGLLFLRFNEETFCLVKQVFFQSCLLLHYRKIIVESWVLLLFFFEYPRLPTLSTTHPDCYSFTFFFFLQKSDSSWPEHLTGPLKVPGPVFRVLLYASFSSPQLPRALELPSLSGVRTGVEPRGDPCEPGTPVPLDVLTCGVLLCLTAVCWAWVPVRGPSSPGGHRKWMCFSESQVQPTQKQQKHRLFHWQANSERGKNL